jgi:hypothetical protein
MEYSDFQIESKSEPAPTTAERFMALFSGLTRAYGKAVITRNPDTRNPGTRGKIEAIYTTVKGQLTVEIWQLHLDGEHSLGVLRLRDDGTVRFAGIDVDVYPLDVREICASSKKLGLPLIPCRSKSGGAHWYIFFSDDVPAALAQRKLRNWASALGYPAAEIFPKQVRLAPGDCGNYLNMPYYGKWSLRYAYGPDGVALDAEEFLDYAESSRITAAQLEAWPVLPVAPVRQSPFRGPTTPDPDASIIDEDFDGYESAGFENVTEEDLWHGKDEEHWKRIATGLGAGERHNGVVSLAGLLFGTLEPHLAEVLVRLFAQYQCDPPLRGRELHDIVRHAVRRELAQ